jgi:hypothetical protein
LSNSDGQIIGGGVGGPLKAAGPVQVILEGNANELVGGVLHFSSSFVFHLPAFTPTKHHLI